MTACRPRTRTDRVGGAWTRLVIACALLTAPFVRADPLLDVARWQQRLLVITAPTADDDGLQQQRQLLARLDADAASRDLLLVELVADEARVVPPGRMQPPDVAALREALALDRDRFAVVLVGLDGGIKLRSAQPLRRCALLGTIDAMPMRRRELGDGGGALACQD